MSAEPLIVHHLGDLFRLWRQRLRPELLVWLRFGSILSRTRLAFNDIIPHEWVISQLRDDWHWQTIFFLGGCARKPGAKWFNAFTNPGGRDRLDGLARGADEGFLPLGVWRDNCRGEASILQIFECTS